MVMQSISHEKIAVIGLGYVGLPLLHAFASRGANVIGFDISEKRISELRSGVDVTRELSSQELDELQKVALICDEKCLSDCTVFIVTVPTPVDGNKVPNLRPVISATQIISRNFSKGSLVIYESTVFPGTTEDVCVPILERSTGWKSGIDFEIGYSPERINPGDKINRLSSIMKIVSVANPTELNRRRIENIYNFIVDAGLHFAPTIKVAEAAKVCENIQRDVNIALMNELSMLFGSLEIDTHDVLAAAGSKWNFLKFYPGFVGGHCIGVDPYYLVYKSHETTKRTELISAARTVNESYVCYVVDEVCRKILRAKMNLLDLKVLMLGATFKENCPDVRNTKVLDIYNALLEQGIDSEIVDPVAGADDFRSVFGFDVLREAEGVYDVVLYCVSHRCFSNLDIVKLKRSDRSLVFDFRGQLDRNISDWRP